MKFPVLNRKLSHALPQFKLPGDKQVAASFLDAVKFNPDDAWAFVSKMYSPRLDLDEMREVLAGGSHTMVSHAVYLDDVKGCKTRSVYVEDSMRNIKRLLHLRMIREPDGQWKIFGVEQEECVKISY